MREKKKTNQTTTNFVRSAPDGPLQGATGSELTLWTILRDLKDPVRPFRN